MSGLSRRPDAEVIARVAHDLRASLNALAGWGGALEAGPLGPEDVRRAGAAVTRQAHLTARRLDLALDFWRLDLGLLELSPTPLNPSAVVMAAVGSSADACAQRGVTAEVTGDDAEEWVMANARRLAQALSLLIEEAAGLTPAGGRVDVRVERRDGMVNFHVVPLPGSPPRERSGPFTRSLASALIEAQGGRVDAGDAGALVVSFPGAPAPASERD